MRASTTAVRSVIILALEGRLTSVLDPRRLPEELEALIKQEKTRFILNLKAILSLDCSGIGLLVTLYRSVREAGGDLKFLKLGERPRRLLEICGLLRIFETFESEEDALASFIGEESPELHVERKRLPVGFQGQLNSVVGVSERPSANGWRTVPAGALQQRLRERGRFRKAKGVVAAGR